MQEAKILGMETQDPGLFVCETERERWGGFVQVIFMYCWDVPACPSVCVLTWKMYSMNSDMSPLCLFTGTLTFSQLTRTPFFFSLPVFLPLSFPSLTSLMWLTFCLSPRSVFGFILLFSLFLFCLCCLPLTNTVWWFGCIRTLHWDPDPSTLQLHSDSELMGYCSSSLL